MESSIEVCGWLNLMVHTQGPLQTRWKPSSGNDWQSPWRSGTRILKRKNHIGRRLHRTVLPSFTKSSLRDGFQVPTHRELKRAHPSEYKRKTQGKNKEKSVPSFGVSFRLSRLHASELNSRAYSKDWRKNYQQELEKTTKLIVSIHQIVKLRYVRAVYYWTYQIIDRAPRYNDSVSYYISKIVHRMRSRIKMHTINPLDPISMLGFLML